ncbi:dTMP kinase [Acidovorax sp. Leaf160]|uniref:dTMP kinase n=1 Tax=Acidovorax sp. Leaf160 TaxID=1736280 RepID=UPI0006FB0E6B|nr:thymidylate kinase [Acidovorax sp. Leaf160]
MDAHTLTPDHATPAKAGLFITFEGIDGAGKSSHIDALAAALRGQGRQVVVTREPGGTPLAEKLRTLLLNDAMDPLTEALLVFAGRRDHLRCVIEPALARGDVVLCDRFTDATFAYQGAGRGFDIRLLSILERMAQAASAPEGDFIRNPDLTLWFDLPPADAAARLAAARTPDRFESQPEDFFARVAQGYADRAAGAPERFVRLDARQERSAVWAQLAAALAARGHLPAAAEGSA